MSRTEIRHATLSDASLLAELGSRTFYEAFAADTSEKDMAAYLAESFTPVKLAAQIADRLSLFFIAENNGEAIGYARLYPADPPPCINGPNPIQLARLYALKEWYGQGVGSSLMKACLSEARWRGYQTMWLSTWNINVQAISFYHKWQFQQVGTQNFQVGTDIQSDVVLMRMI